MLISPLIPDPRQSLRHHEQVAWQSEHERPREDRDDTAPRPSSLPPYEDGDYPTSPPAVRRPLPPRPAYDDKYDKVPPTARHFKDPKFHASSAPSHLGSHTALPERNQLLPGALNPRIFGGTFAAVAGNMIIHMGAHSGPADKQVFAGYDDEDADAQGEFVTTNQPS
jgi:hypothetical protein